MSPIATLSAILGVAIVAGLVVSLPFLWLVKRSRREGAIARSSMLTRSGVLLSIPMAAALLAFFAWPLLDPQAPAWSASWWARAGAGGVLWLVSLPIERVLAHRGHPTTRPRNDRIDRIDRIDGPPAA